MAQTVEGFFSELQNKVDASKAAGMNAAFQFDITGDGGGQWHAAIANGNVKIAQGAFENPSIVLTASAENWLKIVSGELSGQTAFLTGKLKIKGDMSLAMKLQSIFQLA